MRDGGSFDLRVQDKNKTGVVQYFSLHPSAFILVSCGVAKLVRHRIVNPAIEGSNPSATARL
jgi:hypothetical protein